MQPLMPSDKERTGYPTQKPERLLDRIIRASSSAGDLVLDAFCGCGTACAVSQKIGRRWIGIDISPSAIALVKNRLSRFCDVPKFVDVIGMPTTVNELKTFKHFDFQYWVINELHGTPSPKKVGDMGIDGLSFFHHYPIQVKQSESVGRNVVDNFETALRRYYGANAKPPLIGFIVAFSFTKGAHEEVARAKKDGFRLELVSVQRLLDKKFTIAQEGELFAG
jgi:SAM-dependent methyltransferase